MGDYYGIIGKKALGEVSPLVIERYSPFVHLSIAQGEVIDDTNRN